MLLSGLFLFARKAVGSQHESIDCGSGGRHGAYINQCGLPSQIVPLPSFSFNIAIYSVPHSAVLPLHISASRHLATASACETLILPNWRASSTGKTAHQSAKSSVVYTPESQPQITPTIPIHGATRIQGYGQFLQLPWNYCKITQNSTCRHFFTSTTYSTGN